MAKYVVFSVAGSGKSTFLIEQVNLDQRFLIITYTNANIENLRKKLIKKFGYVPKNVVIYSFFSFLYSFCLLPYVKSRFKLSGICYEPPRNIFTKKTESAHYMLKDGRIYSSRMSKMVLNFDLENLIKERVEKYFDSIFVDEVQDLTARDFDILRLLSSSSPDVILVGDFYQHTFETSRDGVYRENLYENYEKFKAELKEFGYNEHPIQLTKSYRCSPTICEFVEKIIGISIGSHRTDTSTIKTLTDENEIRLVMENDEIVKLFYSKHYEYKCFSGNWGGSKGIDHFQDVCVVLNAKTNQHLISEGIRELPSATKNKLYVAITRARGNVYLVSDKKLSKYKNSFA